MTSIRVALPVHLQTLAKVEGEVPVDVDERPTIDHVLDQLEAKYPPLRGTIREHGSGKRRAYIRYFTCGEDVSHQPSDRPLPADVVEGREVFQVIGAISGG